MKFELTREWLIAALTRAIRTFAQTFLGFLAVGMAISDINWAQALSVSAVAALFSIVTAVAGLPETKVDGTILVDKNDPDMPFQLEYENDEDIQKIFDTMPSRLSFKTEEAGHE